MEQTLLEFLIHTLSITFIVYLIKDAHIFDGIRSKLIQKLTIWKVQGKMVGDKLLQLIGCPICLAFWIGLALGLLGIIPIFSCFYQPIAVGLVYNSLTK